MALMSSDQDAPDTADTSTVEVDDTSTGDVLDPAADIPSQADFDAELDAMNFDEDAAPAGETNASVDATVDAKVETDATAKILASVKAPAPPASSEVDDLRAEVARLTADAATRAPAKVEPAAKPAKPEGPELTRVQRSMLVAARSEMPDGATDELVGEFAVLLQNELYLDHYVASGTDAEKTAATKQLTTLHEKMRQLRHEARTTDLEQSLKARDASPEDEHDDSETFDVETLREGMAESLADEKSLDVIAKSYPNLVEAVRAGLVRPDDDILGLIGKPATHADAQASVQAICSYLETVCGRLDLGGGTSQAAKPAGEVSQTSSGRAVVDPSALGMRRDESRQEPTNLVPSTDDFDRELAEFMESEAAASR